MTTLSQIQITALIIVGIFVTAIITTGILAGIALLFTLFSSKLDKCDLDQIEWCKASKENCKECKNANYRTKSTNNSR